MRWSPIFSWPWVILFALTLAVAPASATQVRLSSTNITSSLLVKVGALARRRATEPSENKPSRSSEESAKAAAARTQLQHTLGISDGNSLDAPIARDRAPIARDRALFAPAPSELFHKYNDDKGTYDDKPKHMWPIEAPPALEVKKHKDVDDTVEEPKKQEKQEKHCTSTTLKGHKQEGYCYYGDDGILRFRPE